MARIMITSTLVLAALFHAVGASPTKAAKSTSTTKATSTPAPTATGTTTVQYIHPHSAPSKCLTYFSVGDGVAVEVGACGASDHPSEFLIQYGDNPAIYVPGTNLCLTHHDGANVPSVPFIDYCRKDGNSDFYYTTDQRLAITGGTTCLDYGDNVDPIYGTPLDFRTCADGDNNQVFTLENVKATVTSTTAFPDPTTICHQGDHLILKPAAGTNITQQYPSGKIPFQYCSPFYFQTSSANITVYLAPASSTNPAKDGVVVGSSNSGNSEYDLTLTIPKGTKPAANSQLFVLEYYYGSQYGNTETISEAVKF